MQQALTSKMLWFTRFDLANEFLFLYALIMLQLIFALCACVPIEPIQDGPSCDGLSHDRVERSDSKTSKKTEYKTIYFQRSPVSHGSVLQILAETARLEGVTFQDLTCIELAVKDLIERLHCSPNLNYELKILQKIHAKQARLTMRFFFVAVLQTLLQLNVQMSMMAVSRVVTGNTDKQLLLSIFLTIVPAAFMDFPDTVTAGLKIWNFLQDEHSIFRELKEEEREQNRELVSECEAQRLLCYWVFVRYCVFMVVYIVLLVFTIMKFFGFFLCRSHILNWTGCAELPSIVSTANESHILSGATAS